MKTFVNSLSAFRIFVAFAIIPLFLFQMHWIVFTLFTLAALSDFFDGYLARKYNATSKLGGVLDHIGDKLLVVNSLVILAVMMRVWFIMVPVILIIARELYVSGLREFMGTQKSEMPVPKARFSMGKVKTALQMISVGAFFLLIALGSTITPPITSQSLLYALIGLPYVCICGLWLTLVASLWSATMYTFDFRKKIKNMK